MPPSLHPTRGRVGRVLVACAACAVLLALLRRGLIAFSTPGVLEWDETYYASIASTALAGLGLYPFVQGYPSMPVMGGIGYAAYLYVAALDVFGPTILGLRVVSFAAAAAGLAGVYVVTRRWYGVKTAVIALVTAAASTLFGMTNSVRMDALTFGFVAWLLVLFAIAIDRQAERRWLVLTGVVAALGLEFHLHTIAAASACGFVLLVDAVKELRATRSLRPIASGALARFVAGYLCGALLFVAVNIAPAPSSFFRTAGLTRLAMQDDTAPIEGGAYERVTASFGSPARIVRKEVTRYALLVRSLPWYESLLWIVSVVPLLGLRRHANDGRVALLIVGAVAGAAVIVNGTSPLYESHIWPILLLPIAPLVTHGFASGDRMRVPIAFVALVATIEAIHLPSTVERAARLRTLARTTPEPATVTTIRTRVSRGCHLAGDTSLYVPYFIDYPRFTGTRETEVRIGSTYYGLGDNFVEYWKRKQPDIVFGPLTFGLSTFLRDQAYEPLAADVWRNPRLTAGCVLSP